MTDRTCAALSPTPRRICILGQLIKHGTCTGADLLRSLPNMPRGTLYTTLQRLEVARIVSSELRFVPPRSSRRFYVVTPLGRRCHRLGRQLLRIV